MQAIRQAVSRITASRVGFSLFCASPFVYILGRNYTIYRVTGPSMSPSLSPEFNETGKQDWVLFRRNIRLENSFASEGGDGVKSDLKRGMVVLFKSPVSEQLAIKRIVALEGDRVKPIPRPGKRVYGLDPIEEKIVTVPFGHVWVGGDQVERLKCVDSNDYGPISKSLIEGVAVRVVKPWARSGPVAMHGEWEKIYRGRVKRGTGFDDIPAEWAMA